MTALNKIPYLDLVESVLDQSQTVFLANRLASLKHYDTSLSPKPLAPERPQIAFAHCAIDPGIPLIAALI